MPPDQLDPPGSGTGKPPNVVGLFPCVPLSNCVCGGHWSWLTEPHTVCIGAFVLYVLLGAPVAQAVFDAERVYYCMLCSLCIQLCVQGSVSLSLDSGRTTLLYALLSPSLNIVSKVIVVLLVSEGNYNSLLGYSPIEIGKHIKQRSSLCPEGRDIVEACLCPRGKR